ncbi:hypothetical protein TruAng_005152 [Truncatella angustata]|nr:hypothetical protein TruAng_005152 [Truncatella angustata]
MRISLLLIAAVGSARAAWLKCARSIEKGYFYNDELDKFGDVWLGIWSLIQSSAAPACVTYIWTGSPVRSQFKCGTATAITSMLDEPQFVIDASISASKSSESAALASSESASRASVSASLASEASEASLSKSTATLSDGTTVTTTAEPLSSGTSTSTNNTVNTGVIVGAAVGGGLGLLLLLLLIICCCRRRRKSKKTSYNLSYKKNNNEKTTIYDSRREKRSAERRQHGRQASRARSQRPSLEEDHRDDETYQHGFIGGLSGQSPSAPRQAHVTGDDRPVYAPQYHFHVVDGGRNSRQSSIVETTRNYRDS